MANLIVSSPPLRARERAVLARYALRIRDQLALELAARADDLRPAVAADTLMAAHQAVIDGYRRGLLSNEPAAKLSRRMYAAAVEAFDLLANGLAAFATQPCEIGMPDPSAEPRQG